MQTDYAPECLHTDVPSKEALLAAAQDGSILQATAARCDVQHNLIVPLDGMTGIMPREECALGIDTGKTREIAILSRVGKPVSFQVLCIRGDVAYVSRKRAQQRAFEQLLHKRPGDILPVRVTHLEPFGAFVDAGCGLVSLIGIENLSVSRIFHPSDRVQVGQQLAVGGHRQRGVIAALAGDVTDALVLLPSLFAVQQRRALVGQKARNTAQHRCFPGTIFPQYTHDLPVRHGKIRAQQAHGLAVAAVGLLQIFYLDHSRFSLSFS